jgi:hypothetical protein
MGKRGGLAMRYHLSGGAMLAGAMMQGRLA